MSWANLMRELRPEAREWINPSGKRFIGRIWFTTKLAKFRSGSDPAFSEVTRPLSAVISHEMYELEKLRPFLQNGTMSIDDFIAQTEPGRIRNYHDQAWDFADAMVDRMRGASGMPSAAEIGQSFIEMVLNGLSSGDRPPAAPGLPDRP